MSWLEVPRLHFAGHFQADVSTINNDVRHYDNAGFIPEYQEFGSDKGSWNPQGTAIWRFVDCRITGVRDDRGLIVDAGQDSVIGVSLGNADARAPGKLVDLDPQQQMVSEIWGLQVRLDGADRTNLLMGDYEPAAFINLWQRQQKGQPMDQQLAAVYTSILSQVQWADSLDSPALRALRAATADGFLSIHMNVYGYGRDPAIPRYTLGRVNGTIGPWRPGEPRHFALGRQLSVATSASPFVPDRKVFWFCCRQDAARQALVADFGNCLPIESANGPFEDVGKLQLGVLRQPAIGWLDSVQTSEVEIIGDVPYLDPDWYTQTAGIIDLSYAQDPSLGPLIAANPLVLLSPTSDGGYTVISQETLDGRYLRADRYVARLDPAATTALDLWATQWGRPLPGAEINLTATEGFMGGSGAGDQPLDPPVPIPAIATPTDALGWPPTISTDASGRAQLRLSASEAGPGNPRGYIDGQLYGIGYQLAQDPPTQRYYAGDYISVLVFDRTSMPATPSWYQDIQPIFTQYGNLYPIMSRYVVNLGDYEAVCSRIEILKLAFSLPLSDPNHMPVTRDLSADKRAMILYWLTHPGPDGRPVAGAPVRQGTTAPTHTTQPVPVPVGELDSAGKTTVIRAHLARKSRDQGGPK